MIVNTNGRYSINELIPLIEECLASGGSVRIGVTGISMTPLLHNLRDTVVLKKPDRISKYDIVLHKRKNGQYILHRVIAKKGDILTIAGDFETEKEYPVSTDDVLAKVVSFCRNGKEYSADDFIIRLYAVLWVFIFPFRHQVLYLINFIRRRLHV